MPEKIDLPLINTTRFLADFDELGQIGRTETGMQRTALSPADLEARAWFRRKCEEAGLEYRMDAAGNQFARVNCGPQGAPALVMGSHLDSVPGGGRFDGALGVMAALEVVRTVREMQLQLPVHLEAVNFTDEEGSLVGFLGSRALTGNLPREILDNPKCGRAELEARFAAAGLDLEAIQSAYRDPRTLAGYLELHIEQGPRLEKAGLQVGVVDHITGICAYRVTYLGRADHAGTTPILDRKDAGLGASALVLAAREMVLREFPGCVVTFGQMSFAPGAFNIVPQEARLALEFRSSDSAQLQNMEMALLKIARAQADRFGLLVHSEQVWTDDPAAMHPRAREAVAAACNDLGLTARQMPSGAGHDAQMMATVCPAGMIFVPSVDGASHAAREFTRAEDCINGANVLLHAALRLAGAAG